MFRLAISLKIGATMRPVFPSSGKRFYKKKSWKVIYQRKKQLHRISNNSIFNFKHIYTNAIILFAFSEIKKMLSGIVHSFLPGQV